MKLYLFPIGATAAIMLASASASVMIVVLGASTGWRFSIGLVLPVSGDLSWPGHSSFFHVCAVLA